MKEQVLRAEQVVLHPLSGPTPHRTTGKAPPRSPLHSPTSPFAQILLRAFAFDMAPAHPHHYLLHFVRDLEASEEVPGGGWGVERGLSFGLNSRPSLLFNYTSAGRHDGLLHRERLVSHHALPAVQYPPERVK